MSERGRRFCIAALLTTALASVSEGALADVSKDQCIDANANGQELRREGKLMAARTLFRTCGAASCPAIVRDDCMKRLDELEKAQPTIAFEVTDASGADVSAVKVTVDGKALAERLDGKALGVDIGEHVFTFEAANQPVVTRRLVLTEGEKGRRERIVIGAAGASTLASGVAPTTAPAFGPGATTTVAATAPPSSAIDRGSAGGMGTQRLLGLVLGGIGVTGIALGSVFGVMTLSEKGQQESVCGSSATCTSSNHAQALSDHSTGMTDSTIATVGFIAGGALLASGAFLFFTARPASGAPAPTGILVVPSVSPAGGGMSVKGRF